MRNGLKKASVLFVFSLCCTAGAETTEDPHQKFPTSKNHTNKSVITWTTVKDVQAECERQSHRRGYGGFNYPVEACSFWGKDSCEIVTSKVVNFHTVGHEIRHCFQGNFHK